MLHIISGSSKFKEIPKVLKVASIILILASIFSSFYFRFYSVSSVLKDRPIDLEKYQRNLNDNSIRNVDLAEAKSSALKLLSLIRGRYELNGTIGSNFFRTANNIGSNQWDIIKYKFANKIVQNNSSFFLIFGGSSVTAGHDNHYNQSYPYIIKKRMAPILKALGIELVVHNIAQGANNCIPYVFCYESMGGHDFDVLGWEQSYNCGRDEPIFELTARYASWSANKGLVYFSASGAWSPSDCPESHDNPPFSSEDWTPDSAGIADWNPTVDDLNMEREMLDKFYEDKPSAQRFSSWVADKRQSFVHGFNVWEENRNCKTIDKKGANKEFCNGIDAVQGCTGMRFLTKEASVYGSVDGRGAGWHPPRAFHMLRGEAFAWLYTLPLLDSIYMVEKDMKSFSKEELQKLYSEKLEEIYPVFKTPKKCMNLHCDKRPICYTDFRPHYPKNLTLSELIVGNTSWVYDPEPPSAWSLQYGFLDSKPMFTAKGEASGEIHIRINIGSTDFLLLCGTVKDSLKHTIFYLDADVKDEDLANYIPSSNRVEWPHKRYLGGECKYMKTLPTGSHVISVRPNNTTQVTSGLSHVVMWP